MDKLVSPELVLMVFNQLDEGDEKPPRVGSVHYQSLQQNPGGGQNVTICN